MIKARHDEILIIRESIARDIRSELSGAKSVMDDMLRGSDDFLISNLPNFNQKISAITVLVQQYAEYVAEQQQEGLR